jgi:hypothetical protein
MYRGENKMNFQKRSLIILMLCMVSLIGIGSVAACGGLFCQNVPVAQQAERIIFTINGDGTISAYVQINYTGDAPSFSWVVPVPTVPEVDVAEMATFDELDTLTAPIYIAPQMPPCAPVPMAAMAESVDDGAVGGAVEVLASGTAGPYQYDVVDSPDPNALVAWLRDNDYQVTPDMEPLIHVYNAEGMPFLAMKLQPEQGVQDIQPVVMTYESENPMIPLRLTAVAANPNMNVVTWVFADTQVVPANYAHPVIHDADIRGSFGFQGGTNYLSLVDQTVDLYSGRAFITEYAQPTSSLRDLGPSDTTVQLLSEKYRYVTRFFGRMSPEEMTVDPVLVPNADRADVSNVHDLSGADPEVFWNCNGAPLPAPQFDNSVLPGA